MLSLDLRFVALLLSAVLVATVSAWRKRRSLPPGPKGVPFFGNVFDVPKEFEWLAYDKWSRQYSALFMSLAVCIFSCSHHRVRKGSDIIYLNLAGTPVIVVNTAEAAHELFEKRSSFYSDRFV